ncbi:MAG: hypothetical protein ACRDTQ_16150 [Micromonosporaceae bacterium]
MLIASALAGVLIATGPASASAPSTDTARNGALVSHQSDDGWMPVNYQPYDVPAGNRCDFPVHVDFIRDEVMYKVLETYPDGSPKREAYTGDLIIRYTNKDTGVSHDGDASGDAVIDYFQDGSQTWYVRGPVSVGVGEDNGNIPRGIWIIDGVFKLEFSPEFDKTLTMYKGTKHNICEEID